ncbi:MAG: hypothetical protein M5U26_23655 [Planctomycetota bacterium]|nr:hypothetical protein [Planctomycetota bacterium]
MSSLRHSTDRQAELEQENARLLEEISALRASRLKKKTTPVVRRRRQTSISVATPRATLASHVLAPGYVVRGWTDSIYTNVLRVISVLGELALQEERFRSFIQRPSAPRAREILNTMLVPMDDLIAMVRQEDSYREHCERRTRLLYSRSAKGDKAAQAVLQNPQICQRGRWVGNFEDVFTVLREARTPATARKCENVKNLHEAKLLFDVLEYHGKPHCVLYPARCYGALQQARSLAGI